MRQVVFDTETTGLEPELGHRIIEIGAIEIVNRRRTGRQFHRYVCPEREIDPGAVQVHGLTTEFLRGQPRFADVFADLREFIAGAELVIHNAPFDVAFLDAEIARLAENVGPLCTRDFCGVLDTLALARQMHPGQRNTLDALCKRYSVDNSHRELHGALLDAELLAEVFLAMTRGQESLMIGLDEEAAPRESDSEGAPVLRAAVRVLRASADECAAHDAALADIAKANKGLCLWLPPEPASAG